MDGNLCKFRDVENNLSQVPSEAVPNVDNAVIYHESHIGNLLKTISILLCEKKRK